MIMYTHGMAELLKLQTESTSLFLGRAVARAPISGFVILPVHLSQLASGEVSRVAIGFKAV